MAALDFPSSPSVGQQYPSPAVSGQPVYTWDGEKWTTKGGAVGSTGAYNGTPAADSGAGGAGSSTEWSRGDHFHPAAAGMATIAYVDAADALKAPLASPALTGNPTAPTPALADNDTSIATTAFVKNCVPLPASCDFNTIDNPGTYYSTNNTPTNAPTVDWYYLQVFRYDANTIGQIAIKMVPPSTMWFRIKQNTWNAWASLIDSSQIADAAAYTSNNTSTWVRYLTPAAVWSAGSVVTITDAASVTPDFSTGFNFFWSAGAAGRTLNSPSNQKSGQSGIILIQNGANVGTWGGAYKFAGGVKPTLSTGYDAISYYVHFSGFIVCTATVNVS